MGELHAGQDASQYPVLRYKPETIPPASASRGVEGVIRYFFICRPIFGRGFTSYQPQAGSKARTAGRARPLRATTACWEVNAMDMEFLKMFSVDGVWALLSVALIFYILKSQEKRDERQDQREQNYQQMILSLTETAKDITDVKQLLQDHLCAVDEKSPE
ncbi:BhlA/UviB family holin-like peptide [Anaerotruncus massiliensis (ex Liu et al. 2021)]